MRPCRPSQRLARAWNRGAIDAELGRNVDVAQERRNLAGRRSLDQWVSVWEKLNNLFAQAEGINLDRKQVVLNAFFALEAAAR